MYNALHEVGTMASRHPGFFAGILTLILYLISRKIRQLIFYGVSRIMYLVVRKTYLHKSLGNAFIAHVTKNGYKHRRLVGELYGESSAFIKSERDVKHILFRDYGRSIHFFHGKGFWNWVILSGEPLESIKDKVKEYSYIVYSWRWTNDIVKLLDEATEGKNEQKDDDTDIPRFVIKRVSGGRFFKEAKNDEAAKKQRQSENALADPFSDLVPVKWDKSNIGEIVFHNTLEMMSLNQELQDVIEEIKFWFNSQEWYEERGIPWKRGMLFYGPPGSGKTMLTRAIAEMLNTPLIIFDLASMNNTEFVDAWSQILPRRIALFEDIDAVFHKRENIVSDDLTFDCLLNCLDGADKKQGILTIVTTNHPEWLDPALGGSEKAEHVIDKIPSRPGRIDRTVRFTPLDEAGRMKVAMRILKNEELARKIVRSHPEMAPAQLQEKCFRVAVDELFKKRKAEEQAQADVPMAPPDQQMN